MFKLGQRVMVSDPKDESNPYINKECGTILGHGIDTYTIAVQFDKFVNGHDCDGRGTYGYCWYVPIDNITPILSKPNNAIKALI